MVARTNAKDIVTTITHHIRVKLPRFSMNVNNVKRRLFKMTSQWFTEKCNIENPTKFIGNIGEIFLVY